MGLTTFSKVSSTINHNLGSAGILTRHEPHWFIVCQIPGESHSVKCPSIVELPLSSPRKGNPMILFKVACALPSWKVVIQKLIMWLQI